MASPRDAGQRDPSAEGKCSGVDVGKLKANCWRPKAVLQKTTLNINLTRDCLTYLADSPGDYYVPLPDESCSTPLLVHMYWAGDMTWKLMMTIRSFLYTHSCPLCTDKPILNLWFAGPVARQDLQRWAANFSAPFLLCSDQLRFAQWSRDGWLDWLPDSVLGPVWAPRRDELRGAVLASASNEPTAYSDAVRFLLLYHFGGVYLDADCLILRDLRALSATAEFVYEWSYNGDPNTAVIGLKRGSAVAAELIRKAVAGSFGQVEDDDSADDDADEQGSNSTSATGAVNVTGDAGDGDAGDGDASSGVATKLKFYKDEFPAFFWPRDVYINLSPANDAALVMLPCLLFDPLWLFPEGRVEQVHYMSAFDDAFKLAEPPLQLPASIDDAWRGAFVYHWHNYHNASREDESIMGRLASLYEQYTAGRLLDGRGRAFSAVGCPSVPL